MCAKEMYREVMFGVEQAGTTARTEFWIRCFDRRFCCTSHSPCSPETLLFNPLNAELNPICYLLTLLAHHFLHVSRIRVKSLTLRLLMSGRSPAEIVGSIPTGGMDICLL